MIIDNFDFVCVAAVPAKADSPLIVHADAVLALAPAFQRLEAIAGRYKHLPQFRGRVQHQQLAAGIALNCRRKPARQLGPKYPFRFAAGKTQNHRPILTHVVISVKLFKVWEVSAKNIARGRGFGKLSGSGGEMAEWFKAHAWKA